MEICSEYTSLLSYLDKLLCFFHQNLQQGPTGEVLADKYNKKLKEKLFEIFDDEISKFFESANSIYEKNGEISVFGDLKNSIEDSIDFRHLISVETKNDILDEILWRLSVLSSNSVKLMSNYLLAVSDLKQKLDQKSDENFGEIIFLAGLKDWELFVQLKSVGNLKPRENHDDLNFRICVSILPLEIDNKKFKIEQKTLIYPNKTTHLVRHSQAT